MITRKIITPMLVLLLLAGMAACSGSSADKAQVQHSDEAAILIQYLEENGDIINHPDVPFFISAEEVHNNLSASNYHVIDVRPEREFLRGHIANAINITPDAILDYFENRIEPNSFQKIVVVCNNSHLSGYTVAILRMLGYSNTFHMRFGLSAWNDNIARRAWGANVSEDLEGKLVTSPTPKNQPGDLPVLATGKTNGYDILRARAQKALEINWDSISIHFMDVLKGTEDYYIVNYWPEALYNQGHFPGAIQYTPKKSLRSDEDIHTLPTSQPIVAYCFSGQNSAYVNALLSLMGYEFRSLDYGANGFIHRTMANTQPPGRVFSASHIKNYPLVTDGLRKLTGGDGSSREKVEVATAQGGC